MEYGGNRHGFLASPKSIPMASFKFSRRSRRVADRRTKCNGFCMPSRDDDEPDRSCNDEEFPADEGMSNHRVQRSRLRTNSNLTLPLIHARRKCWHLSQGSRPISRPPEVTVADKRTCRSIAGTNLPWPKPRQYIVAEPATMETPRRAIAALRLTVAEQALRPRATLGKAAAEAKPPAPNDLPRRDLGRSSR